MNRFLLVFITVAVLSSCSRTSNPTGPEPYPVPPGQPVPGDTRYPDQSRRNPDPYPDGGSTFPNTSDYPREGQRDGVVTIIKTGNANSGKMPPGQAKKKYGSKSAKVYAPGQQKKNGAQGQMATVIAVPDQYAARAANGQLFYNYKGNTYWKQHDGYYHIATTNDNNVKNNKGKGKSKDKQKNKGRDRDDD